VSGGARNFTAALWRQRSGAGEPAAARSNMRRPTNPKTERGEM